MTTQHFAKTIFKSVQNRSIVAARTVILAPKISVHRAHSCPATNTDITNYQYSIPQSTQRHQSTNKPEFSIKHFFDFMPSTEKLNFGERSKILLCSLHDKPFPTVKQSAVEELFEFVPSVEWFTFGSASDMIHSYTEDNEFDLEDLFDTLPSVEDINIHHLHSHPEV